MKMVESVLRWCVATLAMLPLLVAAATPRSGWWSVPTEPGRMFFIEARNGSVFAAEYGYQEDGSPAWRLVGPTALTASGFAGTLSALGTAGSGFVGAGAIAFAFSDSSRGTVILPNGASKAIERFEIVSGSLSTPPNPAFAPETGWWWNPGEGLGFSLEVQAGNLLVTGFMYNSSPVWFSSSGRLTSTSYSGNWIQYANGSTLTGSPRPPAVINANVGSLRLEFATSTTGTFYWPDGRAVPITRFVLSGSGG